MKIALFSKGKPSFELGATKNRLELAKILSEMGWEVSIFGSEELGLDKYEINIEIYSPALKNFLLKNAINYDVVLYDHDALPYNRNLFSSKTLFVARPALLEDHLLDIKLPIPVKDKVKLFIKDFFNPKKNINLDYTTLKNADLIQVQNSKDKKLLISNNIDENKICIIPNGISESRLKTFKDNKSIKNLEKIKIVFVGTFDYRKGMCDIIWIFKKIKKKYPEIEFKLLGTKGMFQTSDKVYSYFPHYVRSSLEVVPIFDSDSLPLLLSDCNLSIFTSYLESFGYAPLEIMAAGIPVVSYSCPGPCDFIPSDLLINVGDKSAMLNKLLYLIENRKKIEELSDKVADIASAYNMNHIGKISISAYLDKIGELKNEQKN